MRGRRELEAKRQGVRLDDRKARFVLDDHGCCCCRALVGDSARAMESDPLGCWRCCFRFSGAGAVEALPGEAREP